MRFSKLLLVLALILASPAWGQLALTGAGSSGSGSTTPILLAGARTCIDGNSRDAHINMRAHRYWSQYTSTGHFYPTATGIQALAGDRYEFVSSTQPGYITRVPNCMAQAPEILWFGDATNNVAASQSAATINGLFDALIAAVVASPNYSTLKYIIIPTTPTYWTLNDAQNTALLGHNTYLKTKDGTRVTPGGAIFKIPDVYAFVNYAMQSDGLHANADGAFTGIGNPIGTVLSSLFDPATAYPPTGAPVSLSISSIVAAGNPCQLGITAHGRSPGEILRITGVTGGGLALTSRVVGSVPNANTIELLGTDCTGASGSGTAVFGLFGDNGSGVSTSWTAGSGGGVTYTASKETFGGKTYQAFAVTGTATSDGTDERIFITPTLTQPFGGVREAWTRFRITDSAGTGAPVGLASLSFTAGQALALGSIDVWTITVTTGVNADTITLGFYNANTVPCGPPCTVPWNDANSYLIKDLSFITASTNTTTNATALKDAINADATLAAAGITATSATNVVTILQTSTVQSGTLIFKHAGTTALTIAAHVDPFTSMISDGIMRLFPRVIVTSATAAGWTVSTRPIVGIVDYKVWFADPLYLNTSEATAAYATPYDQTNTNIYASATTTLAASIGTVQTGYFSGGNLTYTYQWYSAPAGVTVTETIASPSVLTIASHGFSAGQLVSICSNATCLSAGGAFATGVPISTTATQTLGLYVCGTITLNTFNICTDIGGTNVINTSGSQSGTHTLFAWTATPGATDNPHDFSGDGLPTGNFVYANISATNSFGTASHWPTKSTATLP